MYVQMDEKKKQLDEEKERRRSIWAWTNPLCTCTRVFLSHQLLHFLPPSFLSIFRRKIFGGSREKTFRPTIYFSSSLSNL